MTTPKQLYSLQEFDLVLDRIRHEVGKAEKELNDGHGVEHLEASVQAEDGRLQEAQSQHRLQSLEIEEHRDRSKRLDDQLYGGAITNPRDLESLEQEASNARELVESRDTGLLELASEAEDSKSRLDALTKELEENKTAWDNRRGELQRELERCTAERESLMAQRTTLADTLDPTSIRQYEGLRRSKRGVAVSKVERGLCSTCRMSLPTRQRQQVRSGKGTVLCSSCGRILC